jgi:hypothetical protein
MEKIRRTEMENNNKSNNNSLGSFLLGVLVGAALMFFFTTKKGKKILKAISEKGLDNISDVLEDVDRGTDLSEAYEENPSFAETTEGQGRNSLPTKDIVGKYSEERPKVRRFFRGISRHIN